MNSNNYTSAPLSSPAGGLPAHLLGDGAWAALGRQWLAFVAPARDLLGDTLLHTALSFGVFWVSYIVLYNFFRAIDKHNLLGLKRYKLHERTEPQELNDKVVDGLRYGFWKGAVRSAVAYWVFFSGGRQPVSSFPRSPLFLAGEMLLAYFTFDLGFYWFHRAAHHPRLYKHLHKQHHQFKVTNVGATAWNDAGESFGIMIISDLTALLFKFDLFTWLVWILWSNILDFQVHCGYLFPWNPLNLIIWPPVHDYHHWQNRGNFATSHWDFVFGTAGNFLAWRRRQDERRAKGLEEEPERRTDDDDEVAAKEQ